MSTPIWRADETAVAVAHCRYLLGDEYLAFLAAALVVDPDDERCQRTARKIIRTIELLEREDPRLPVALLRPPRHGGPPLAWEMRRANGGDVPDPVGSDELRRTLTLIARDVYPVLLAPSDAMISVGRGLTLPAADVTISLDHLVHGHPAFGTAQGLLSVTGLPSSALLLVSAYQTAPLAEAATPGAILATAASRLRHRPQADAAAFMSLVLGVIDDLHELAAGREVEVPAAIGFASLTLPDGCELELPQGRLRNRTRSEARMAPFSLLADSVLDVALSCRPLKPDEDLHGPAMEGQHLMFDKGRDVILAAALSSPHLVPRWCPCVAWIVGHGFGHGVNASRPLHPDRPTGGSSPPSEEEVAGLLHWASLVAHADLTHVTIAVDRLLRAMWEPEWPDALIDAVIAWENLMGTTTETSFRVTAALTVLCEDDPQARLATRRRLGGAYDARSRVVHGEAAPADLHHHHHTAVEYGLEALRRLIEHRNDLLSLTRSSKRADQLLLGIES